jgi:CelD/BcsL family acetyltransferase involved in cellulose biosynthesis
MKIECLQARQLAADLVIRWHEILRAVPQLAGPYFRPEFVTAVAAVRNDVEVAVLRDAGQIVGFFPFQRSRLNAAQPVGGRISDYQGVIAAPDVDWRPEELLAGCRLSAWEFDHQLAWQSQLQPHFAKVAASPVLDLSRGYEAWLEGRKAACGSIKETLRKARKLQRDSEGGVAFQWHTTDRSVFQQLLEWKSAQYVRTGAESIFRCNWIVKLLDRLRTTDGPHLSGVLSTLRAGGELVAIHFGMHSDGTLHSWFPSYDSEHSRCSPGQILLLNLAEQATAHGVRRIDMGKGTEDYKLMLASDTVEVAEGALDRRPLSRAIRRSWSATRQWVKGSPLGQPARAGIRWLRRMREWLAPA